MTRTRASRRIAASLAAWSSVFLAACAGLEFRHATEGLQFEVSGRIAVSHNGDSSSGNLSWRHRGDADEMLITSPLGQGIARIVREGAAVTVTTADAREYRAESAESLTEQVLGFRLPLVGLADWVRARPASGPARARRDAQGRLAELQQDGWTIEYLAYGEDGRLPARMRLRYPGLDMRLAISAWR